MNATFRRLDDIDAVDESRSGSKAYNCARLKRAGFPVPDGLVVLSTATDADVARVPDHPWFDAQPPDALFAVRSSGIGEDGQGQSFAGIHETLLNVPRGGVRAAVATCRASAQSSRALAYRRAVGMPTDVIESAVLIQQMVNAVTAGVAFTVNPLTGARDEMIVNASWGLGEALVSGQIEPDEIGIRKSDRHLLWQRTGERAESDGADRPCLTARQVDELALLLLAVEKHYGTPQDVEWCHDGHRFWIVQSRPVTAEAAADSNETEWTRANLAEVLPEQTSPQALAAFEELLNKAEQLQMGRLLAPETELGPMVKSFHGRLYFNLSQMRRVCTIVGVQPAMLLQSLGHPAGVEPEDERVVHAPIGQRLAAGRDVLRMAWQHVRVASIVSAHQAGMREYLHELTTARPDTMSDEEVWNHFDRWREESPEHMQVVLLLGAVLFHEGPLRKLCARLGFSFERLVYPHLASGERSVSAQQAYDLVALAQIGRGDPTVLECLAGEPPSLPDLRRVLSDTPFLAAFERFLDQYGHRGLYESDWALPRFSEDPAPVLRAIGAHLKDTRAKDPAETARRQAEDAAEAWREFGGRLTTWQRLTVLPRVRRAIRRIKQYYLWRERTRSDMIRILAALRKWHLMMAERLVSRGWLRTRDEYFLVTLDEIAAVIGGKADPSTLQPIAAERAVEVERQRALSLPLLMRESQLPRLMRTAGISGASRDSSRLSGHPVSAGCVEADVVVVHDPGDFGRMKRGAILVARATDPSWTPLFTLASGVIVEVGGVLSHASTVAREYGLPALANVKQATRLLRTGERVRLDAIQGFVERLAEAPATEGRSRF
jgi:pyruvate,water dikinase